MQKWQFVLKMREMGFTDYHIGAVIALRARERAQGVKRRGVDYLSDHPRRKDAH